MSYQNQNTESRMYGLIILAGITVALCGKAQSCSNTLVNVGILQDNIAIGSL